MFYQIQYQPKGGDWMFHKDIHSTYQEAQKDLAYWRRVSPDYIYRIIKCEVLND